MRLRPYIPDTDYSYLKQWINTERIHAFWCANRLSYPVTKKAFHSFLKINARTRTENAFTATEDDGKPVGFFCYSIDTENNTGFLKYIIIDNARRGNGYGSQMLALALQYAFQITGAISVQLNVFDENISAKHCYEKAGFSERSTDCHPFIFKNEVWNKCNMIIYRNDRSRTV